MYETFFMNQNSFTFVSVYLDPAKIFFVASQNKINN